MGFRCLRLIDIGDKDKYFKTERYDPLTKENKPRNKDEMFDRLKVFLDEQISRCSDGYITVLPLRCGLGKSTYIRHKISDTLQQGQRGLIIITDAIERMDDYINSDYIMRNKDRISVMTSKNFITESKEQWWKPILIMTTQRFFNLSRDEIISYTRYNKGKRDKIIIDEKPYLIEQREIDIFTIDNIDAALQAKIDDTANQTEKQWVVEQWNNLRRHLLDIMHQYEQMNKNTLEIWHYIEGDTISEDDDRFMAFINKHRQKLDLYDRNIYRDILAVRQMMEDGATFIGRKLASGQYSNYFIVTSDNKNKLLDIGADVYILDGTADLSPEYRVHYVNMVDCSDYLVRLDNLTINIVDIPTSRRVIEGRSEKAIGTTKSIIDYLKSMPQDIRVIFTYKSIEDRFKGEFEYVEHFGNIKGVNKFREVTDIAQVGLNRYPDTYYTQIAYITQLLQKKCKSIKIVGKQGIKMMFASIRNNALMADLEQNIFRSKIRSIDCTEPVSYTLFLNVKTYADLIKMMQDRYGSLEAKINIIDTPASYKQMKTSIRNTDKKTNVQAVLDWMNQQPAGKAFKPKEIREACELTLEAWKNVKKSDAVKNLLNNWKSDVTGCYVVR